MAPTQPPTPASPARRSTRISADVLLEVRGEKFAYAGETITVNLHGALIHTSADLTIGTDLTLFVFRTGKSARARVVYISPMNPSHYGLELEHAENIWGVEGPPDDWQRTNTG
jgi:ribosomal protein L27